MKKYFVSSFLLLGISLHSHLVDIHISTPAEERMIESAKQEMEFEEDIKIINDPTSSDSQKVEATLNLIKNNRMA